MKKNKKRNSKNIETIILNKKDEKLILDLINKEQKEPNENLIKLFKK